jgi:hypothetical protein
MPTGFGPQQFELPLSDSYPANNPADESDDLRVEVIVPVTLFWNLERTQLDEKKDVQFGAPRWLGVGSGPLPVFQQKLAGTVEKVGTVQWTVITEVLRRVETNSAGKKYRHLITPLVRLIRTFTPSNGGSPSIEEVRQNSSTVRGDWISLP